ncbi:B-cell receptor CD22-like isoform X1, partial [Paramuricea clavata]
MATIINNSSLPGVAVEPPATLVLKNVDERYNGKYQFGVQIAGGGVAPNVTINCPSPAAVNEGNDFTCVCRGEGGNPPANVTWYKGTKKIGGTGKEEQTLSLKDVNRKTDISGTYKCVAQSHINATDEMSIRVIVYRKFKPENTKITLTLERAGVGRSFTVTCNSRGVPEPSYNLTHNGTKISTNKTYTKDNVQYSDAGTYKCIVWNKLGSDSASANLTVVETPNVTINCSIPITLDEGEDRTCVCTSEGGNPLANLTWYKDDKQIGNASYGENRLTFTNVTKQHNGTYKCVAQRYTLTDEKSIEVK